MEGELIDMNADANDGNNQTRQLAHSAEYADQQYDENAFELEEPEADENIRYAKIIEELTEFENAQSLPELQSQR
jgi:hypothetical protein